MSPKNVGQLKIFSMSNYLTQDDMRRYIAFSRKFKPKITTESQSFMVEEYKRLRQR